jgi:hypothetical protein
MILFFDKMLPKRSSGTREFRNPGKPFPTFVASWIPNVALVAALPRYGHCVSAVIGFCLAVANGEAMKGARSVSSRSR